MFEAQIKEMKSTLNQAKKLRDPIKAYEAYAAIINEPLQHTRVSRPAILFFENSERADVYYERANICEKIAEKYEREENYALAAQYFKTASVDAFLASDSYENQCKKRECQRKHREHNERFLSCFEKANHPAVTTNDAEKKRRSPRDHRLWDSKAVYDEAQENQPGYYHKKPKR
jgi:hypothetical protein